MPEVREQEKEKLITLDEAAKYLNLTLREIKILVKKGQIPAYRLAGKHLRFKKSQLESFQPKIIKGEDVLEAATFTEKIKDFIYFHDFYIFSLILVILILLIIFRF